MNNRNSKIFKFPRKEMQVSEEINKKKGQDEREKGILAGMPPKNMKNEVKEGIDLILAKELIISGGKNAEGKLQKQRVPSKNSGESTSRSQQFMRMSEKGVLFDKKLTKLVLPDHIEKLKLVSKIENKLLSCLEKKKPLIPMKQLVNLEMLNEILGKKQRRLITDRQHFCENLEVEAHSLKKNEENSVKYVQKFQKNKENSSENQFQADDSRFKMKLMPLRVPVFKKVQEEIPYFQEQTSNFIFQQAPESDFSIFNQDDTIFDCINNQQNDMTINFGNNPHPKSNSFEERKSNYIERQSKSSFFANINEYQYDKSLFKSNTRHPSQPIFPYNNRPKVSDNDFSIARLKLPRQQQPRRSESNSIFPIEEETSHFFSPDKQQRENNNIICNGRYPQAQNYWRGKQSSSGSSDAYY